MPWAQPGTENRLPRSASGESRTGICEANSFGFFRCFNCRTHVGVAAQEDEKPKACVMSRPKRQQERYTDRTSLVKCLHADAARHVTALHSFRLLAKSARYVVTSAGNVDPPLHCN